MLSGYDMPQEEPSRRQQRLGCSCWPQDAIAACFHYISTRNDIEAEELQILASSLYFLNPVASQGLSASAPLRNAKLVLSCGQVEATGISVSTFPYLSPPSKFLFRSLHG